MLQKKAIFVSAHSPPPPPHPIAARVLSSRWASIVSAPTACNLQVEADFQPSATNCSSFSDIKALRKCDFFDLFSLTGHHFSSTPPLPPLRHRQRRRAAFTSSPVSFLLALFVFCARRITTAALLRASRCFVFLAAVTLSLISLLSPSSFPLLLILAASCHACSCIISFDNLYTERRACACVCVCVRVCAFHENICLK